ncbi:MAG: hypothetical protein K9M45_14175 [Kiritimatiellales bacterium]|nr:hypothetical protein [Kiritimatiellales bacterium]
MKVLLSILTGIIGVIIGLLLGSFGVFYACILLDKIMYPNGVPTGGGFGAVGWIFLFITVPVGGILGGIGGFFITFSRLRKKEKKMIKNTINRPPPLQDEVNELEPNTDIYR